MFCGNCGTRMGADARFCENCGAAIDGGVQPCGGYVPVGPARPSYDLRLVGFSQKTHDPVFGQMQEARFRKDVKMGLIALPAVILLFQIAPFFSEDFTRPIALVVGCIVGGFGLACTLVGGVKRAWTSTWDGEVVDKAIVKHTAYSQSGFAGVFYIHTLAFDLAGGGRKKMRKRLQSEALNAWDMMAYLNIGDRVRYHGKLDYYEKYDKSCDAEVPCANCRQFVDIRLDNCPRCHAPIIKP